MRLLSQVVNNRCTCCSEEGVCVLLSFGRVAQMNTRVQIWMRTSIEVEEEEAWKEERSVREFEMHQEMIVTRKQCCYYDGFDMRCMTCHMSLDWNRMYVRFLIGWRI